VVGYPTLALVAAMARARCGDLPVCVAMTGGHGEWFVAGYGADGEELRPCAGLSPENAAQVLEPLIAGSQAKALVAARGSGEALPLWPDAREFTLLDPALLGPAELHYGRAPDARLPGGVTP